MWNISKLKPEKLFKNMRKNSSLIEYVFAFHKSSNLFPTMNVILKLSLLNFCFISSEKKFFPSVYHSSEIEKNENYEKLEKTPSLFSQDFSHSTNTLQIFHILSFKKLLVFIFLFS